MLTKEFQVTIQVLHQQGMSARAISRELNLARQTVLDVIHQRSDEKYGPRASKPTKLEPYHEYIAQRLAEASPYRLAASVILREIQALGYSGCSSQLRVYMASIRPLAQSEPIIRFETEPGQQMQIDFVVFRRGDNPLRAFTACLGYSRMSYVEFTNNERAETWVHCMESAFSAFGGVPKSILCDNAKSIVLERHAYGEGKHRMHPLTKAASN
jgi:transposase